MNLWICYDHQGYEHHPTPEAAAKAAAEALEWCREESRYGEAWPVWTDTISWGVWLFCATEHDRKPATCPYCEQEQGEAHDPECDDYDPADPERRVNCGYDYTCDYRLVPVPGAIEAVLGMASVEQLRAELARREGQVRGCYVKVWGCHVEECLEVATHAPAGRPPTACWQHAGDWPKVACTNTLARTAEDRADCAEMHCPHRPVGCDWRAALEREGLIRQSDGSHKAARSSA